MIVRMLVMLLVAAGGFTRTGAQEEIPAEDLGTPITSANRISYATVRGFGAAHQDLLCWTTTAESGGHFVALDLSTGDVRIHPLNHLEAYPIVFGSDGRVHVGSTSGEVFAWDPVSNGWGPVGQPLFRHPGTSINHVRVLCEGDGGWLYAGSCYGERARVHMRTGVVEHLPPIPEKGNWYISAVARLANGRIAFGTGYQARVFLYDPLLGADVAQILPQEWTSDGFCLNLIAGNTVLYATHFPSGRRGAFDISSGAFLGVVPWRADTLANPWSRWVHSSPHGSALDFYRVPGTDAIVALHGDSIHRFDPRTPTREVVSPVEGFAPDADLALALRYEVTADCEVIQYDPLRREVERRIRPAQPPVARKLFGLGVGPDGKVYGGGYQSTLLFRFDPESRSTSILGDHHPGWSGETFSYAIRRKELICASYTNGAVVGYDPSLPWKCERGGMENPRLLGFFGQHLYRPLSTCVAADGRIWSVGPAGWGSTGGGIGWIDPDRGSLRTTSLPDAPHTLIPLSEGRFLAAGDSLLRWWDAAADKEIAIAPTDGRCLAFCQLGDSDDAAILTDQGKVLLADCRRSGRLRVIKVIISPFALHTILYDGRWLVAGGADGAVRIDPYTGTTHRVCTTPVDSKWAFVSAGGSLYFGSGARLMRIQYD